MSESFTPSRTVRSRPTQFRARREENAPPHIEGCFVVFDQPYYVDDTMEEVVMPGAFDGADMDDVRALVDHLSHLVLGRSTAGTLTFSLDDTGLYADITVNPADTDAMNLYARVQRGDVDQASFGFDESDVRYTDLPDGRVRREIHGISKLWEISVCTFPAYEQTSVSARSRLDGELSAHRLQAARSRLKAKFRHHE